MFSLQRTAEIAIRYQLVQMALEYLQMLGQVALLRHTTVTLVERFGGRFLEQGRELARIVQYRDGVATEGIVSVLHDRVRPVDTAKLEAKLIAHEGRYVPVHFE